MRIHTDKLSAMHIIHALQRARAAGRLAETVTMEISRHGSQSHRNAFELRLESSGKVPGDGRRFGNSGSYGATSPQTGTPDVWAATYDEWGWVLAEVYASDPDAVCGRPKSPAYANRGDFDTKTALSYNPEQLLPLLEAGNDPYPWLAKGSAKAGRHGAGRYPDDWSLASLSGFANRKPRTPEWYRAFARLTAEPTKS